MRHQEQLGATTLPLFRIYVKWSKTERRDTRISKKLDSVARYYSHLFCTFGRLLLLMEQTQSPLQAIKMPANVRVSCLALELLDTPREIERIGSHDKKLPATQLAPSRFAPYFHGARGSSAVRLNPPAPRYIASDGANRKDSGHNREVFRYAA